MKAKKNKIGDTLHGEQLFLNEISKEYVASKYSHNRVIRQLTARTIQPFLSGGAGLELGCSDGYMSELLAKMVDRLDVLDASKSFLHQTEKRGIPNAKFICSLFEEFKPKCRYDVVFATFILEHLVDVKAVLKMIHKALKKNGLLYVVVPNAYSLSRQLALQMGLLPDLHCLTPNDTHHGHRRVYNRVTFDRDLHGGKFEIIAKGGIMLKPFADFQMDKLIDHSIVGPEQIEGLYRLGLQYPDLSSSLFAVCKPS